MKLKFKIKGIDCANCATELERKIRKIDGVTEGSISFMAERMIIECEEQNKEQVIAKIKKVIKKEEPDARLEEI